MDLKHYDRGDRVFAKYSKFSPWPAMVRRWRPESGEYEVYFYGTHDRGNIKYANLFDYNEENIKKFGTKSKRPAFKKGMIEIAEHMEILDSGSEVKEPQTPETPTVSSTTVDVEPITVLFEADLNGEPEVVQLRPKLAVQVVNSGKQIILSSKSITNFFNTLEPPVLPPELLTPLDRSPLKVPPTPSPTVTRSGRIIKRKAFADDEIQVRNNHVSSSRNGVKSFSERIAVHDSESREEAAVNRNEPNEASHSRTIDQVSRRPKQKLGIIKLQRKVMEAEAQGQVSPYTTTQRGSSNNQSPTQNLVKSAEELNETEMTSKNGTPVESSQSDDDGNNVEDDEDAVFNLLLSLGLLNEDIT